MVSAETANGHSASVAQQPRDQQERDGVKKDRDRRKTQVPMPQILEEEFEGSEGQTDPRGSAMRSGWNRARRGSAFPQNDVPGEPV